MFKFGLRDYEARKMVMECVLESSIKHDCRRQIMAGLDMAALVRHYGQEMVFEEICNAVYHFELEIESAKDAIEELKEEIEELKRGN